MATVSSLTTWSLKALGIRKFSFTTNSRLQGSPNAQVYDSCSKGPCRKVAKHETTQTVGQGRSSEGYSPWWAGREEPQGQMLTQLRFLHRKTDSERLQSFFSNTALSTSSLRLP